MPEKSELAISQRWTDLKSHTNLDIDRNRLSAILIHNLVTRLEQHKLNGLNEMLNDWHTLDLYLDKQVKLITGKREVIGKCKGVNNQGALMLEVDGQVKPIYGGEVSLRGI
jgi:BirA family biotin operon repressor/biotin-[acetyl-CoA-carboxylase] ligase